MNAALKAVQNYYAFIFRNKSLLEEIRLQNLETVLQANIISLLKLSWEKAPIIVFRAQNWKPTEVTIRTVHQVIILLFEHFSKQPQVQENGLYMIADLKGFRFEHFWAFSGVKEIRMNIQILVS